jgi:hypothetical protein
MYVSAAACADAAAAYANLPNHAPCHGSLLYNPITAQYKLPICSLEPSLNLYIMWCIVPPVTASHRQRSSVTHPKRPGQSARHLATRERPKKRATHHCTGGGTGSTQACPGPARAVEPEAVDSRRACCADIIGAGRLCCSCGRCGCRLKVVEQPRRKG